MMAHAHPSILIIDDYEDSRDCLVEIMRAEGYAVDSAAQGRAALDKLKAGPRPCIILLDLMMPTMTGFEFRREQLADPELHDIPIIVCSCIENLPEIARRLKANAFISKPIPTERLIDMVREHCLK